MSLESLYFFSVELLENRGSYCFMDYRSLYSCAFIVLGLFFCVFQVALWSHWICLFVIAEWHENVNLEGLISFREH